MLWASSPTTQRFRWCEAEEIDHVALQAVRVLVLVDEHVAEPLGEEPANPLVLHQQDLPVEQEVVEVHGVHAVLALGVAARHAQDVLHQGGELRASSQEDVGERRLGVHRHGDEVDEDVGLGEAACPHREPAVGDGGGHHVATVLPVEDGVSLLVSEQGGVLAEDPVGDVVEGAAPDAARVDLRHLLHAAEHLPRRLVGEGEQQQRLGIEVAMEEPGHAPGERPGLARSGAGDDEQRAVGGLDDRPAARR